MKRSPKPKYNRRKSSLKSNNVIMIILAIIIIGFVVYSRNCGQSDLTEVDVEDPIETDLSISITATEADDLVPEENDQIHYNEEYEQDEEPVIEDEEPVIEDEEQADSDYESYDSNDSAAFRAIKTNDLTLLNYLIISGVGISATIENATNLDLIGFNAFHYAAYMFNIEAMRLLLIDQAGFRINDFTTGQRKINALHIVAIFGIKFPEKSLEAAEFLLIRGADINLVDSANNSPAFFAVHNSDLDLLNKLILWNFDATYRDPSLNFNVLHLAMSSCNRPVIKALIAYAPGIAHDVNMFNREPIHEAAAKNCVNGLKELILVHNISKQTLSPPSSELKYSSKFKNVIFSASPLHYAALFKRFEAAEFLLMIQADFNCEDEFERIARDYAGGYGQPLYDYFTGRMEWERRPRRPGQVEDKLLYIESQSLEYQAERIRELRGQYLHQKELFPSSGYF